MPLPRRWLRVKRCDRFPTADENFSHSLAGLGEQAFRFLLKKREKTPVCLAHEQL
jgi:hypothetical protein